MLKYIFLTIGFTCVLATLLKVQAQSNSEISLTKLENEYWWGGPISTGELTPLANEYDLNMDAGTDGNQLQPLLLSNKGRLIWSEAPMVLSIDKNVIHASVPYGDSIMVKSGLKNLKGAYRYASENFFPSAGEMPASSLFTAPQYNTWIELVYDQNEEDILNYANSIIENDFPAGVLMIDDNWQEDYGKWNFHQDRFNDPKRMMDSLHNYGFEVMLWICPFVSPDSDVYRELVDKGAFVRDRTGEPAMIRWWNGVSAVLDLSNPVDKLWFESILNNLTEEYNVDGFKFDAGDSKFYQGDLVFYNDKLSANDQTLLFAELGLSYPLNEYRATWKMGGQPLAQRLRDKTHHWEELQKLIPQITLQGLMGYPFTCPDMIGGGEFKSFENLVEIDQDLVVRSAQVHALMPMMQFSVAPWRILDKEHMLAVKGAVDIRTKFVPTIMKLAQDAAISGEPIVRSMDYVFPNNGYEMIKDQFMLGDNLLVAPMIEGGPTTRKVILPKGRWVSDQGKKLRGGREIEVEVPLERIPYFHRL